MEEITLTPVESSQIEAIGYSPARQVLAIKFKNKTGTGPTYEYDNVSQTLFDEFLAADSKGRFFRDRIKSNSGDAPLHEDLVGGYTGARIGEVNSSFERSELN
jgi:hypothetical protein